MTWRPLGPRIVGIVVGIALVVVCAFAWIGLGAETRAQFTLFQRGTLIFLFALGFAVLHALVRSRAVATRDGLTIVNGYRSRELAWAQILAVHLPPGAPWVTLDLADGTNVSVMGIQGSDGDRARVAARQLRGFANELTR